jgi:hypothetical protein
MHGPPCIEYQYSLPSSFSSLFHLPSLPSLIVFFLSLITHSYRMPFIPSSLDPVPPKATSLPLSSPTSNSLTSNKLPSFPDQMNSTTSFNQMNPYQLIALKARQATKEREARRKARVLERGSQNSGSGSSGMMSSGESSLGDESFPQERSEWGVARPTSTSVSPSLSSPTSSSIESSESQQDRNLHAGRSIPNLITTTHTTPLTQASFEQDSQKPNGPVPPPIPNGMNDISHETTVEEEDDDADLKRLMNQAQAMLNISGDPSSSESTSPDKGNDPRVMDVVTEVDMGRVVGTSVSVDPNDERR